MAAQERLGQQRRDEVAGHELAALVDEEAAVGVAVPGDAEIGVLGHDALAYLAAVLLEQRIGLVVGEVPVHLEVQLDAPHGRAVEDQRRQLAGHAVGGVHDDPQRGELRGLDERQEMVRVVGIEVLLAAPRLPREAAGTRSSSSTRRFSSGMPCSPESGRAPSPTSFIPL